MNPLIASCINPLWPCPLGHPSAMRAPNMATAPPKKAPTARTRALLPKRSRQTGGTASTLKLPSANDAANAPRKIPTISMNCQSTITFSLAKYGLFLTCTGARLSSMNPAARTKVVDAPRYCALPRIFVLAKTDTVASTPTSAPAILRSPVDSVFHLPPLGRTGNPNQRLPALWLLIDHKWLILILRWCRAGESGGRAPSPLRARAVERPGRPAERGSGRSSLR